MCRLVSIRVFYILGGGYIAYGSHTNVNGFLYGSIVSVIHYVSPGVFVQSALLGWFWGLPSANALNAKPKRH